MATDGCKGCRNGGNHSREDIDRFLERLEKSTDIPLVNAEAYERRLEACRQCESLHNGTCRHCGCYVEIRAKLVANDCPNPLLSKWR